MSKQFRPIVCLDFDGVISPYSKGWQDGSIYDDHFVPGFPAWAIAAQEHFRLVIYSSRSKTEAGRQAMQTWMRARLAERMMPNEIDAFMAGFEFAHEKPAAWLTIDDRAIRFTGDWNDPILTPNAIFAFKPWNKP
jgi:hypothetical protein